MLTALDGHLGGGFLNFWPKWVINITKLGMQICSFWQNSRPLRPKMALIRGIIEIERAVFVLLALFWHMKRKCLGKAKSEGTFLHTLLYSNTRKEDFWSRQLAKAHTWVALFLCNFTAKWNICAHCCIPALQRKTFVKSSYQVTKLCAGLPIQHSKEHFCQILKGF